VVSPGRPKAKSVPMHRWLVLAEESFLPADSGARTETLAFLQAALTRGIACYVLVPGVDESERPIYEGALPGAVVQFLPRTERWTAQLSIRPYIIASRAFPPKVANAVLGAVANWRPTAVISSTFRVSHIGATAARTLGVPLLIRPHNLESAYFQALAGSSSGLRRHAYWLEAKKLRRFEEVIHSLPVAGFADISEDEAEIRRTLTARPVHYLPPFLPTGAQSTSRRQAATDVLFLGSLDNSNNVDALRWFLQEAWGRVLEHCPATHLIVVGRRPSKAVFDLVARAPSATVMADLPDIDVAFVTAGVFINPMRRGAGVNIKVIEATGRSVPVVCTSVGLRGLGLVPNVHALVADEPGDFADAVCRLLRDQGLAERLASAAHGHVTALLNHDRLLGAMMAMLSNESTTCDALPDAGLDK
jgi:glycosyltransferase involved in cell wall biosynthesis